MNNFIKMLLISFFMLGAAKADDNEELPSGLNEFFLNAIEAAETRNFDWLSEHTAFPFCLMKGNTRINVKSKDDFKENSEIIFTPDFIDELKKSKGTPIFNNWQGYMVANGRLWADGGFGEFELTKINSPNVMRCYQESKCVSSRGGSDSCAGLYIGVQEDRYSTERRAARAIANGLAVTADDAVFDELVALASNRAYGRAREMLVLALGNGRDPRAVDVSIALLADEQVVGHAVMALGKLKAKAAKLGIQELLKHPKAWIRAEAAKALAGIDKD